MAVGMAIGTALGGTTHGITEAIGDGTTLGTTITITDGITHLITLVMGITKTYPARPVTATDGTVSEPILSLAQEGKTQQETQRKLQSEEA